MSFMRKKYFTGGSLILKRYIHFYLSTKDKPILRIKYV